jgi:RimJ/RimL family protein N-acetyltransferase
MSNISLYVPKLEDYWFEQQVLSDEETMNYNAGYDVSYYGYHYDTGCIDFPNENWLNWYNAKISDPTFYYAYILDENTNDFIGYVNYKMDVSTKSASMGIVINAKHRGKGYMRLAMAEFIKTAKQNGVKKLTDTVPASRSGALKVFFDCGFVVANEIQGVKFNKPDLVYEIELNL